MIGSPESIWVLAGSRAVEEEWILLVLAARLIGPDAKQRLERAWMERTIQARDMKGGIPPYEPGDLVRIDCRHSRLFSGRANRWYPSHENVEVRKADAERLALEASGAHSGPATEATAARRA
jgi:hypothetical protein